MAVANENKDELNFLIYNTDDIDLSNLFFLLKSLDYSDLEITKLYENKQRIIDGILCNGMTSAQKLLLGFYLHFYAFSQARDIVTDDRLKRTRERLKISDRFPVTLKNIFEKVSLKVLTNNRSSIEAIFEPNSHMIKFSQSIVEKFYEDGVYTVKEKLRGLSSKDYEHEFDRKALEALKKTPGLDTVVRKFNQYSIERIMKVNYTGSNVRVTDRNLPSLYKALTDACSILDIKEIPDLYLETGFINAFTTGVERPIIVLTTECVELLSHDELMFVIGHELGHIKSQHVLYHQIGQALPYIGEVIGTMTLGIGKLVSNAVEIALYNWYRKSEFTADRAGLLCCQNADAAISAMIKIAGMPPKYYGQINTDDFLQQAREFQDLNEDNINKVTQLLSVMYEDHPWTVLRASEMDKWINNGGYKLVMDKYGARKAINSGDIFMTF